MLKVYLLAIKKQLNILFGQGRKIMNNFIRLMKQKKTIILLAIVVGLGTMIFLVFRFLTPFGAVVKYQFNSMFDRDKLSKIKGAEETSSFNPTETGVLQIPQQIIRQSVVTFNLKLITKPIEGVWVNLRFKGDPKEIKLGVRGSEKENYQYQPLYNKILNFMSWSQVLSGKTTLWQREKTYKDISELVSKPPVSDEPRVASYFFDPADLNMIQDKTDLLASSKKGFAFDRTLRGSHTFYVRIDTKPLIINIEKQDSNGYKGEDVLLIELYKGDNIILKKEIPDDGISDVSGLKMALQTEQMKIDNLELGVYKLVLTDKSQGMDILITKVETNQSAVVSKSPLYILDNRPATVWTNSKKITVTTWHNENLQTVKLDSLYDLKIDKTNEKYEFNLNKPETADNTRELHQLDIPKNDLIISGDGCFSFSKDSFFNPEQIKTIDLSTVTQLDKIDYIITNYQPVKKEGEWYTAQAYFDPKDIVIDGDKLYFSLESPELSGYGGEIVIDSLEVTVKKPGWFNTTLKDGWNSDSGTVQKETNKQNIFTRFIEWIKKMLPFSKPAKPTPAPTAGITPTSKPSPTATTSATPASAASIELLIRVLNGGAEKGSAASVSAILKNNGFTNVKADNADNQDYKGVTINYRKDDIKIAEKIELLLKKDYGTITKTPISTSTAEIVAILGKK